MARTATALPDAQSLAVLVSNVTQTMCGVSFSPQESRERPEHLAWRVCILMIAGRRPIRVVLSSDEAGATALGAALLGFPAEKLGTEMIEDSLKELLNMAAGQIKRALSLDQALGLPKVASVLESQAIWAQAADQGIVLRSNSDLSMLIWITEGA
jgi:Chemotaxis phosphatase CheX